MYPLEKKNIPAFGLFHACLPGVQIVANRLILVDTGHHVRNEVALPKERKKEKDEGEMVMKVNSSAASIISLSLSLFFFFLFFFFFFLFLSFFRRTTGACRPRRW